MKVSKIESAGNAAVYNMEVDDTHSFVVNGGIIAHNCYDETRYFLMARPMQAKEPKIYVPHTFDPLEQHGGYDYENAPRWVP